ncbi:TDT family transporter [Niallia endozanthoxylica]|uniref:Uncharacterized protein n=1 Tax=Niallia endozanthoxylica TaxID=2036016 RepID=A0A5J5HLJ4_9BACI|nr:hypothetical protein [Niallia endozanthoxylica]KAA9021585.1 hypothetical protein F4V44_16480 [Niallia endozanthoxylica]
MTFLLLFITILLLAIIVNLKVDRLNISTVAGAPIMAMGIMLKGIFTGVGTPVIHEILFYFIISISYWVIIHYTFDLLQGEFFSSHIKDPLSSFSIGTWIAATSIMTVLLSDKEFLVTSHILLYMNLFMWLLYVVLIVRNYLFIFQNITSFMENIHGGLLLPCVATQSIVISGYHAYGVSFPQLYANILLVLGIIFYLLNLCLIVFRYYRNLSSDLTDSWKNTNCIIHGAMSITGVSIITSHVEASTFIAMIWLTSFTLFLIVEIIEIIRAIQRIKKLGWKEGLFIYFPTQWARIFTFGMFLFFTKKLPMNDYSFIEFLQNPVLVLLPIMIVILILIEIYLLSTHYLKNFKTKHIQQLPSHEI